jgi:hypothetical protein
MQLILIFWFVGIAAGYTWALWPRKPRNEN